MGELLGQPVVVENKPGANGLIGGAAVASAPPDGYTMLLTDRGALGVNPSLYRKMPYDPARDFEYVGIVTVAAYVLVVDPRLPAKTLGELVALAKASPGKINYASFGIASMAHLNIEALKARLAIGLTHVPYKGAGPRCRGWSRRRGCSPSPRPPRRPGTAGARARDGAKQRPRCSPTCRRCRAGGGEDPLRRTIRLCLPAGTPRDRRSCSELKRALASPTCRAPERAGGASGARAGTSALVRQDIPRSAALQESESTRKRRTGK